MHGLRSLRIAAKHPLARWGVRGILSTQPTFAGRRGFSAAMNTRWTQTQQLPFKIQRGCAIGRLAVRALATDTMAEHGRFCPQPEWAAEMGSAWQHLGSTELFSLMIPNLLTDMR